MHKSIFSLLLLITMPTLMAGKPVQKNNRLAIILAAKIGDVETVRQIVDKKLVTYKTMVTALKTAQKNNPTKTTDTTFNNHTLIIEFLFDQGVICND